MTLKPYRDHPEEIAKARELSQRLWTAMMTPLIARMEADAKVLSWMGDREIDRREQV